jgi:hypothetical protein
LVALADHGVDFPVADAGFSRDDGGAFVNAHPVPDLPALVL